METTFSASLDCSRFREVAAWRLPKFLFPRARLPQFEVLARGSAVSNDNTRQETQLKPRIRFAVARPPLKFWAISPVFPAIWPQPGVRAEVSEFPSVLGVCAVPSYGAGVL